MNIRNVEPKDAARIADIYNHYIATSMITFEVDPVSAAEIEKRIREVARTYPYLVLEDDEGEPAGFAYASKFREREAYRYTAEVTIYFDKDRTGKGLGGPLFAALLDRLGKTEITALIGAIALPNGPSVRLHEKFGFRKVAHLEKVGYKFGQWIDVGYWELLIRDTA
jgi:L-amino acid N-acyltransferase YncA